MTTAAASLGFTTDQVRAWVERTCQAQGFTVPITDPAVLSRVGVLLGVPRRQASAGRGAPTAATSEPRDQGGDPESRASLP